MDQTTPTLPEPTVLPPNPLLSGRPARVWLRRLWWHVEGTTPFASNVGLTAGANLVLALVALATGPISARLLGPMGRGELAAIQNLYWTVATLAMMGLPEATLYFIARRRGDSRSVLTSGLILTLLVSPLFFIGFFPFVPTLLAAQSANVIRVARWYLLGIPLYALIVIPVYSLRGCNDIALWNVMRVLPGLGWLVVLLIARFVGSPSSQGIALGYLAMLAALIIPTALVTQKRIPGNFAPESRSWPGMLKYGLPLAGATIPTMLNLRLDQMLLGALLPAKSLGLYVVAVAWSGAVTPLLSAVGSVLFPRLAASKPEKQTALLAQGLRLGIGIGLPVSLLVALLTPVGIPFLFGSAFQSSVTPALILVFATAVAGMNSILEEGLRGLGRTTAVFWSETLGLLVTALGLALLLKPLGIIGASLASLIAYSATSGMLCYWISTATELRGRDLFMPPLIGVKAATNRIIEGWFDR